jgi:hypothetical protein
MGEVEQIVEQSSIARTPCQQTASMKADERKN